MITHNTKLQNNNNKISKISKNKKVYTWPAVRDTKKIKKIKESIHGRRHTKYIARPLKLSPIDDLKKKTRDRIETNELIRLQASLLRRFKNNGIGVFLKTSSCCERDI